MTVPLVTPRGVALQPAGDAVPMVTLANNTVTQVFTGPGVLYYLLVQAAAGASWVVLDGTIPFVGRTMSFMSFTNLAGGTFRWPVQFAFVGAGSAMALVLPVRVTQGLQVWNPGPSLNVMVVAEAQDVGPVSLPRSAGRQLAGSMVREAVGDSNGQAAIPAGTGVLLMNGPGVVGGLVLRTTPGNPVTAVRVFDGLDTTGTLYNSNPAVTNSGNSFDYWVINWVRMKRGLFVQNDGPSTLDIPYVITYQ